MTELIGEPKEALDPAAEAKRLKKLEKSLDTRQLDPWERYRALIDLLDTYVDMIELADRKTRFALVILGALNALNFVVAARPTFFSGGEGITDRWVIAYAAAYVAGSLYLVIQAIGVLRPRAETFLATAQSVSRDPNRPRGTRFVGDVIAQTPDEYYESWQHIENGQLNRELALYAQAAARVNADKYRALYRLYNGLIVLTILTGSLVVLLVARRLGG